MLNQRKLRGNWFRISLPLLVSTALHAAPNVPNGPGCQMAHCDPQMSDNAQTSVPSGSNLVSGPDNLEGSGLGLGCASNLTTAACTFYGHRLNGGNQPVGNLRVYDATGMELFQSGETQVNSLQSLGKWAGSSAPIVFNDGSVLAVDDQYIAYYYRDINGNWASTAQQLPNYNQVFHSDGTIESAIPTSPVMISNNIALIATSCHNSTKPMVDHPAPCQVSTWKIDTTGTQPVITGLDSAYIYDAAIGALPDSQHNPNQGNQDGNGYFDTQNTPTVDPQGPNGKPRVYILASEVCYTTATPGSAACTPGLLTRRQGRLMAVDVDPTSGYISSCSVLSAAAGACKGNHLTGSVINVILKGPQYAGSTLITNNPAIDFPGPSGSSPLLIKSGTPATAKIYFDGLQRSATLLDGSGNPAANCAAQSSVDTAPLHFAVTACFFGVQDTGSSITSVWSKQQAYPNSQFQASAAKDSDGKFWIYPAVVGSGYTCSNTSTYNPNGTTKYRQCLLRIDPATGDVVKSNYTDPTTHQLVDETIDLTKYLPDKNGAVQPSCVTNPCYSPSSAITVSPVSGGGFTLTAGGLPLLDLTKVQPRYMAKIKVPAGWGSNVPATDPRDPITGITVQFWKAPLLGADAGGFFPGQFAIVQTTAGKKRTVFTLGGFDGSDTPPGNGPYFVGDQ